MMSKPEQPKIPLMVWAIVTVLGAAIPVAPQVITMVRGAQAEHVQPTPPAPQPAPQPAPPAPSPTPAPRPTPTPAPQAALTAQDWFNRGLKLQQTGRYEEAIEAFKRVILSTDASRTCTKCTFQHKAECEVALGRIDEAVQSYEAALEHSTTPEEQEYYSYQLAQLEAR